MFELINQVWRNIHSYTADLKNLRLIIFLNTPMESNYTLEDTLLLSQNTLWAKNPLFSSTSMVCLKLFCNCMISGLFFTDVTKPFQSTLNRQKVEKCLSPIIDRLQVITRMSHHSTW